MDKKALRRAIRARKSAMTQAQIEAASGDLAEKLFAHPAYRRAKALYAYLSYNQAVRTAAILERARRDGKRVAVPYCIPGRVDMLFCEIFTLDDLSPGSFGVLEPDPERQPVLTSFPHALAFDLHGYRLGYGKGYYDRFLSRYHGPAVGVCYNACLQTSLPHGRFDRMAAALVTEKFVKRFPQPERPARPRRMFRKEGEAYGRR